MTIKIPYGKRYLTCSIPSRRVAGILIGAIKMRRDNPNRLIAKALDEPLGGKSVEEALINKDKILIVVPDWTRKAHLKDILPPLIKRIEKAGRTIDIIIATGLHKKPGEGQLRDMVGSSVLKGRRVMSHDRGRASIVRLGSTAEGIPITLNKKVKEYDSIVTIGLIEPHLYAGFSGGSKTIAIGLAGPETIYATHNIRFLDDPLTRIGSIENNPFQDVLREIIDKCAVDYSVNLVNDPAGRLLEVYAGDPKEVFLKGAAFARGVFQVQASEPADAVLCGIGYPKDANLYQASRAINYVLNCERPVVKKGGFVIVAAELSDGVGESAAEKLFHKELVGMKSPKEFIEEARRHKGRLAGDHRTYMVAKALEDYRVVFVTGPGKGFMRRLPFPCFSRIQDAIRHVDKILQREAVFYVVPRALSTIANLRSA